MKWASSVSASGVLQKICRLYSVSKFGFSPCACKKSVYGIHRAISVSGRGASQQFCVAFSEQVRWLAGVSCKILCGINRASSVSARFCVRAFQEICVAVTEQVRVAGGLMQKFRVAFTVQIWFLRVLPAKKTCLGKSRSNEFLCMAFQ